MDSPKILSLPSVAKAEQVSDQQNITCLDTHDTKEAKTDKTHTILYNNNNNNCLKNKQHKNITHLVSRTCFIQHPKNTKV